VQKGKIVSTKRGEVTNTKRKNSKRKEGGSNKCEEDKQ
jgi:hypothetical protein